jgi:YceI-like domain
MSGHVGCGRHSRRAHWCCVTTAVLDIKIQAASVNTGSGMKNNKLKGKDFFNVEQDPLITFKSTKVVETTTFDVPGTFTVRGVSQQETQTADGFRGDRFGRDHGHNGLRRKDYGMNSGIPFIKIADRVEVVSPSRRSRIVNLGWSTSRKILSGLSQVFGLVRLVQQSGRPSNF